MEHQQNKPQDDSTASDHGQGLQETNLSAEEIISGAKEEDQLDRFHQMYWKADAMPILKSKPAHRPIPVIRQETGKTMGILTIPKQANEVH